MSSPEIQKETFQNLLKQISTQVSLLKKQNKDLQRENLKLTSKLDELQKEKTDIFSSISEKERMAMRHKINSLLENIESHLNK